MSVVTQVLQFKADDKTKGVYAALSRRNGILSRAVGFTTKSIRQFNSALGQVPTVAFAGLAGGATILLKSIVDTQMKMDSLRNSLTVVAGDAAGAAMEFERLLNMSRNLGVSFESVAETYKKFGIAAQSAGLSASETDKIYQSATKASVAMGLSQESTTLALKALEQMMSKGNVQAEELRGQFGEHIPGAFDMAARAMGRTTKEFNKLMESGKITARELLPLLADEMNKTFGPAFEKALEQPRAALNRLSTEWTVFKNNLAQSGIGMLFAKIVNRMSDSLREASDNIDKYAMKFFEFAEQVAPKVFDVILKMQIMFLETEYALKKLGISFAQLGKIMVVALGGALLAIGRIMKLTPLGRLVLLLSAAMEAMDSLAGVTDEAALAEKEFTDQMTALIAQSEKGLEGTLGFIKEMKENLKKTVEERALAKISAGFKQLFIDSGNIAAAMDVYNEELYKMTDAYLAGAIAEEEFLQKQKALEAAFASFVKGDPAKATEGWISGIQAGLAKYAEDAKKVHDMAATAAEKAFKGMEDALVSYVQTGKMSFRDLANSIIADLIRIQIKSSIIGPLSAAFSSFVGSTFGGSAPPDNTLGGGMTASSKIPVGEGGGFTGRGARAGGLDGKGGFMTMLHPNETVVDHTKGGGAGGTIINQTIQVSTGVQQTVRAEIANMMPQIANATKQAVASARMRGGSFSAAMGA